MRHEEIRDLIRVYHQSILDKQIDWAKQNGSPSEQRIKIFKDYISLTEERTEDYWDLLDSETGGLKFLHEFCGKAGLPTALADTKAALLLSEIKSARRDQIKAFLSFLGTLESYEFSTGSKAAADTPAASERTEQTGILLSAAISEYLEENRLASSWALRTADGKRTELGTVT